MLPQAGEVGLDSPDVDLRWRLVGAVGAEIGDVTHPGGFGEVQEAGHLIGVGDPHDGCDEVEAVDAGEGAGMGGRVVPVEQHVAAVARRGAGARPPFDELLRHARAGPPGAAKYVSALR